MALLEVTGTLNGMDPPTLKGADIQETCAVGGIAAAIYFKGSTPLDITLEDTNAISVGNGYGIYTGGALNLLDGGELDVTGVPTVSTPRARSK